ncbi:GNAT family N-acetyltransferase [Rhodococcus sp. SRB_17]|nr:GNAT family N-acetyltransferase [Rhodococcus sp. SRB_17]
MRLRPCHPGDEPALRAVFHSSVHQLARPHYTAEQLQAWAPAEYDAAQWAERLRANRPFVAELEGCIAGFADLQPSGYIDHFFVAGDYAARGVGRALMAHLHQVAQQAGISRLWADVSLSAEPFFRRSRFGVEAR